MEFRKHCEKKYIESIREKRKTIEGRVCRGDWAKMLAGDTVVFFDGDLQVRCKIEQLYKVDSFKVLYSMFGEALLPDKEENASVYRRWFTAKDEKEHGVVGFRLLVVE